MNRSPLTPPLAAASMTSSPNAAWRRRRRAGAIAAVCAASLASVGGPSLAVADAADANASASPPGAATSPAQGTSRQALLRRILTEHYRAGEFVGARIATLDRDGTITQATAGTTSVERPSRRVDADLPWNVGSVTKLFVAVVVLQLAEEGAIDLDAGIEGFMPALPGAERITPRQLLQHTSGLGEYINEPAVVNDQRRAWTPAELIAVAEAAGRVGQPGAGYHYSNTNYIVLGEIIGRVTANPWADELQARIAEPLGLTGTRVMTDERPVGYKQVDGAFVETTSTSHPSIGGAAGALLSTNRDLLTFAKALTGGTLLSADSLAAMQAFVPGEDYSQFGIVHRYGLGIEQYATGAVTVNGHMGVGEAQSAFVGYDADRGTIVAVAMNVATPGPQALMGIQALTAIPQAS